MEMDMLTVMTRWMGSQMERVHTAIPGTIESYDPATRLAVVTPAIAFRSSRGAVVPYKPISGVPVQYPSGSNWQIHGELVAGDSGLLIISEASLGAWVASDGKPSEPDDFDRFSLQDSIFIPGVWPTKIVPAGAPKAGLWLQYKDASIEFKADGGLKITGDVEIVGALKATGPTGSISADLEVSANNQAVATATRLSTHIHPTGVGPTSPPTPGS